MPIVFEFRNDIVNIIEARGKNSIYDVKKACSIAIPEEWMDS